MRPRVRPRVDDDLDALEALAEVVHALDGYPPRLPRGLRRFVESPGHFGAWVGSDEDGGAVVGHVCLNGASSSPVMTMAVEVTGADAFGVVARLFVSPACRRLGVGEQLLATAADEARRRGLLPILDVSVTFDAAIALYERTGWQRLGRVQVDVGDGGPVFDEFVYALPS